MTGIPGSALPGGWDSIPGARGCTPQLCSISDNYSFYEEEKIPIFGISTQYSKEQSEAKQRLKLRYELLSDVNRELQKTLSLPMFSIGTMSFYKRLTMVIDDDIIKQSVLSHISSGLTLSGASNASMLLYAKLRENFQPVYEYSCTLGSEPDRRLTELTE